MKITIPPQAWSHFYEEPPPGSEEFWAFAWPQKVKPGDRIQFFYRLSEVGSDPVIADVLGVKAGQIQGLKDPDGALVEKLQVAPDHIKRLARACLEKAKAKETAA